MSHSPKLIARNAVHDDAHGHVDALELGGGAGGLGEGDTRDLRAHLPRKLADGNRRALRGIDEALKPNQTKPQKSKVWAKWGATNGKGGGWGDE